MQLRPGSAALHHAAGRVCPARPVRSFPRVLCRGSSRPRRSTANRGGSVDTETPVQPPQRQPPAPQRRAPAQQQGLVPVPRRRGAEEGTTIRFSDVSKKQIITRKEGKQLGRIGALWVDLRGCTVVSLDCRPKGNVLKEIVGSVLSQEVCSVLLGSLRQVGDVVLVQSTDALEVEDYSFGFANIISWDVRTRSGEILGKVRDFSFSPDTGQISTLIIDMFGSPSIPTAAVSTFEVTMLDVLQINEREFMVSDDAKYNGRQLSVGFLDGLLERLDVGEAPAGADYASSASEAARYEREVAEWRAKMEQYERQYGPVPREIREQSPQARRELPSPQSRPQLEPDNGGRRQAQRYGNDSAAERPSRAAGRPQEREDRSRGATGSRGPRMEEWLARDGRSRELEDAYSEPMGAEPGYGRSPAPYDRALRSPSPQSPSRRRR
eukprot:jgi/Tetstr1/424189/TSEL_014795.t1